MTDAKRSQQQRPDETSADERWASAVLSNALGEELSARDRAFYEQQLSSDSRCRAEVHVLHQLGQAAEHAPRLPEDAQYARQFVERRHGRRSTKRRLALPAAALAMAAVGWLAFGRSWSSAPPAEVAATAVSAELRLLSSDVEVNGRTASLDSALRPGDVLRTGAGRACLSIDDRARACLAAQSSLRLAQVGSDYHLKLSGGTIAVEVDPLPDAERTFRIATAEGLVTVLGTRFAVEHAPRGTSVRVMEGRVRLQALVDDSSGEPRGAGLEVGTGQSASIAAATARISTQATSFDRRQRDEQLLSLAQPGLPGSKLTVRTSPRGMPLEFAGVEVGSAPFSARLQPGEYDLQARFSADVNEHEQTIERRVTLLANSSVSLVLEEPTSSASAAPVANASRPAGKAAVDKQSPQQVLRRARGQRSAGRYPQAAKLYRRLLREYPQTSEARAALVSLGQLELHKLNQPASALQRFNQYLARSGQLEREARYEKLRALRSLGRQASELREIEGFLKRYPNSIQAAALKQRRTQLRDKLDAN